MSVRDDGLEDGASVATLNGGNVLSVGLNVVGIGEGATVVGLSVGIGVGALEGLDDEVSVGEAVGRLVGAGETGTSDQSSKESISQMFALSKQSAIAAPL